MDKDFLKEMYAFVKEEGYEDSYGDFVKSMRTDESFRNELYSAVQSEGYEGDSLAFFQSVGGKEQKKLKVPEAFKVFHAERLLPKSKIDRPENTDRGQMGEYYKEVNADVEKSWQDKSNRDAFAIYNKERLLTPTLDQWRSMPFDEKVRSYQQNSGKSMQEAREFITSAPNSAEAEMFDSGMVKGAGSIVKDAFSLPTRGIAGLIGGPEAMATTPETAKGLIPSVLSSPTTLPAIASGGLSSMAGAGGSLLSKIPLLQNPLIQKTVEGGLFGALEGGSKALRPEGVTSEEFRDDVLLGGLGDLALGGFLGGRVEGLPSKIAKRNAPTGMNPAKGIELLEWGAQPQNRALMKEWGGKGNLVGKDLMSHVNSPKLFENRQDINSALENMPNVDGTKIIEQMRASVPKNELEIIAQLENGIANRKSAIEKLRQPDVATGVISESNKLKIGELTDEVNELTSELNKGPENVTMFQEGGAINTANDQIDVLAKQIEGKQVPAETMRNLRMKMDQYIDWDKDGLDKAHEVILGNTLYSGRNAIRNSLIEGAEASGNPQYITAMEDLAKGFEITDRLNDVMPRKAKGAESFISNIEGVNKTEVQEALKDYDSYFGTNFGTKAEAVANAKKLNVDAEGIPSTESLVTTGQGEGSFFKIPVISDMIPRIKDMGAKSAGEWIPTARATADALQTPNLGAMLMTHSPTIGETQGIINESANLIRDRGMVGAGSNMLGNLLLGGQSQEDYYNTQSGLK
jgi:hypothetical protein